MPPGHLLQRDVEPLGARSIVSKDLGPEYLGEEKCKHKERWLVRSSHIIFHDSTLELTVQEMNKQFKEFLFIR